MRGENLNKWRLSFTPYAGIIPVRLKGYDLSRYSGTPVLI